MATTCRRGRVRHFVVSCESAAAQLRRGVLRYAPKPPRVALQCLRQLLYPGAGGGRLEAARVRSMKSVRRVQPGSDRRPLRSGRSRRRRADQQLLRQIGAVVRQVVPTAQVILYGSRARGDAEPDSDWDVLVLVDEPATQALYDRIHKPLYDLALKTDSVISLIVEDRRVWESPGMRASSFYHNVRREGRPL